MEPIENPQDIGKCTNPISSSCVIWNGPDIACINLCKGDNISQVVFKLATLLCDIVTKYDLDITALNLTCLDLTTVPSNLNELLQSIIDEICILKNATPGSTTPVESNYVDLPSCLYDGTIQKKLVPEYLMYLADKICAINLKNASLQSQITVINNNMSLLQTSVEGCCSGGSGGALTSTLLITSKCLSGNPTGTTGQSIEISAAFQNMETALCNYINTVGTTSNLLMGIDKQCTGLKDALQLGSTDQYMLNYTNWQSNPTSLAQSFTNLWITVCDMRTYLVEKGEELLSKCAVLPVANVVLNTIGTLSTSAIIKWDASVVTGLQTADSYTVSVVEYTNSVVVGTPVEKTVWTNSIAWDVSLLDENKTYRVSVIANYTCGDSDPAYLYTSLVAKTKLPVSDILFTSLDCTRSTISFKNPTAVVPPISYKIEILDYVTSAVVLTTLPLYNPGSNPTLVVLDVASLSGSTVYRVSVKAVYATGESLAVTTACLVKTTTCSPATTRIAPTVVYLSDIGCNDVNINFKQSISIPAPLTYQITFIRYNGTTTYGSTYTQSFVHDSLVTNVTHNIDTTNDDYFSNGTVYQISVVAVYADGTTSETVRIYSPVKNC